MTTTERDITMTTGLIDHSAAPDADAVQAAAGHVLGLLTGAATTAMIGIGDRLGLYRALADGPRTSGALAAATGTHERYVREWCHQQAAAGILDHTAGTFTLPAATAAVLAAAGSPTFLAGASLIVEGWYGRSKQVADAFRTGGGIAGTTSTRRCTSAPSSSSRRATPRSSSRCGCRRSTGSSARSRTASASPTSAAAGG